MKTIQYSFFLLIIFLIYWVVKNHLFKSPEEIEESRKKENSSSAPEKMVKDPNCGTILPESKSNTLTLNGETHHFCSKECLEEFLKNS